MTGRKLAIGSLSAMMAVAVLGSGSPAVAAELDWGSENRGIITLDSGVTGVTIGDNLKAPDKDTVYGAAEEVDLQLDKNKSRELALALSLGNAVLNDGFSEEWKDRIRATEAESDELRNEVADAVSAIVASSLGSTADTSSGLVRDIRDLSRTLPADYGSDFSVMVASPENAEFQRLVSITDSRIPSLPELAAVVNNGGDVQVRTSAGLGNNALKDGNFITDIVSYTGLTPGAKYRLVGEAVPLNGTETGVNVGETTFIPETSSGKETVNIELADIDPEGMVVFETLYDADGNVVTEHKDVNDRAQQIGIPDSDISLRTSALSSTGDNIQTGTKITDTVRYTGLTPGKEYRLETRMMCKATEKAVGDPQDFTFTAENVSGSVTISPITVTDPDCFEQVVFEKLYDVETNQILASHEDIEDLAQTVGSPHVDDKDKKSPVTDTDSSDIPRTPGTGGGEAEEQPRQVINDVPSGSSEMIGSTIFNR